MTEPEVWLDHARLRLKAARLLSDAQYYGEALTRAYYAAHAASKGLIATKGEHPLSHSGVHNRLGFHFRERLDTALIPSLFQERLEYDYQLQRPSQRHVSHRLRHVEAFIEKAAQLIS